MPKRNRSTVESDLIALAREGSPTAVLLLCAIQRGLTMSEVADRTGITRQAVSIWASGSEGNSDNLKKLVRHLEINLNEIAFVLSEISLEAQSYDPQSLKLSAVIEHLNIRLQEIHKSATASKPLDQDADDDWYFQNGFLKKNLKELFYLAFREKARGFDLAVVRGYSCDEEAWKLFCERHVYDQTREISVKSSLWNYFHSLSDVCRNYLLIKTELDKISEGLDLAPASKGFPDSEVLLSDVAWEDQFDYDRSNRIDYFFYWLSDRDGQEFFSYIFDQIKVQMVNNEPELCIFFHDALDRFVIEDSISDWNELFFDEEVRQADTRIFGDWNSSNQDLDPCKRMKDLGYYIDFKNEEWGQDITEEENWIVFIGTSAVKSRSRFNVPKSCTVYAFEALVKSLGYTAEVRSVTKLKDIYRLTIGW